MPVHAPVVSVTDPLSPALQRVKTVLFAPLDLRKWFAIGFCAWLASCGESGGGTGGTGGNPAGSGGGRDELRRGLHQAWDYVMNNLGWIIPVILTIFLMGACLWVLATWLNSRGKFMLLHNIALNRADIQFPWEHYGSHANSLCLFQLLLGAASFVLIAPLVVTACVCLLLAIAGEGPLPWMIFGTVMGFLLVVPLGIAFAIIKKLLVDFVVPLMYLRTSSVRTAWQEFLSLLKPNLGRFALYILFYVVIAMVIGTLLFLIVIVTCCIAGCLMAIPYIGTVLLLPVFVFKRAYSLYYLEQYGPEFRVIAPA